MSELHGAGVKSPRGPRRKQQHARPEQLSKMTPHSFTISTPTWRVERGKAATIRALRFYLVVRRRVGRWSPHRQNHARPSIPSSSKGRNQHRIMSTTTNGTMAISSRLQASSHRHEGLGPPHRFDAPPIHHAPRR